MSNAMYFDSVVSHAGTLEYAATRGPFSIGSLMAIARQTISTDPIGTTTVTFQGVNAGSEIRVYLPDGTLLNGIEECAANQALDWSVYAPGVNSVVTIRIVSFDYALIELEYTPVVGSQTLPIQQKTDRWALNPA